MRIQTLPSLLLLLVVSPLALANSNLNSSSSTSAFQLDLAPFPLTPRATVWGLTGSHSVGSLDAMLPFTGNEDAILYGDTQVKYTPDSTWSGSLGLGVRHVYHAANILGTYLFVDRSVYANSNTSNSTFWTLSPGVESLGERWDFRINGYLPISSQSINKGTTFVDQAHSSIGSEYFNGHNQYSQMVTTTDNTGPGVDSEVGYLLPGATHLRLYAGAYYFSLKNSGDITGVSGRVEYPISHRFALTISDTYDNQTHNNVMAGVRITLGGIQDDQTGRNIQRRLMDPISRNLATTSQGTSVPVVTDQKLANDGAFVLEKSNIYFFTTNGGSTFDSSQGISNCTYENPCAGTSFIQSTVDSIDGFATNTNFFFAPGTYNSFSQIDLHNGQSLYGRTSDYTVAAQGNDRALFTGSMSLLEGDNRLDSIRLLESVTNNSGSDITALTIQNASNVVIRNSDIQAIATQTADLNAGQNNFANAIYATNSQVLIENSSISATATVNGEILSGAQNFAVGIGGNNADVSNNNFTLVHTTVNASATSTQGNAGVNMAVGIGENSSGSNSFIDNSFTIIRGSITSTASLGTNNNASSENLVTGIGINTSLSSSLIFNNNTFTIKKATINSTASISDNNNGLINSAIGINLATGNNNIATINDSTFNVLSKITGDNGLTADYDGIGLNAGGGNAINITNSTVNVTAEVSGTDFNPPLIPATGSSGNVTASNTQFNVTP